MPKVESSVIDAKGVILYAKPNDNITTAYPIVSDTNGYLYIKKGVPSAIVSGRQTVPTAGTIVQLTTASTTCIYVDIAADTNNSDVVVVGGSGVVAAAGSQSGIVLFAGNPVTRIEIDDVSKLYIDAISNGDGVAYNYFTI